ncbi:hypothetical protein GCK72_022872 [Caenorhabditis remanei]|uniref:Uncharacterized protein n=1 Tax=Caenorhabditis remanei TaxID=31234 RepID=A0A6A5FUX6_CAERE|nr:hypothetical protein GCK72_022872 [Caenorhabditis remanei]KAF1746418.1 hypothetical protein GCK72_022872 [Caenorhabditis remanei]
MKSLLELVDDGQTVIGYDGSIHCKRRHNFCAFIVYMEWDATSLDDYLTVVKLQCTRSNVLHHNAHVIFKGGDGLFNDYYEPLVKIYHDCHGIRRIRQKNFHLRSEPVKKFWDSYSYDVNIDSQSTWVFFNYQVLGMNGLDRSNVDKDLNDWLNETDVTGRRHLFEDDSIRFSDDAFSSDTTS